MAKKATNWTIPIIAVVGAFLFIKKAKKSSTPSTDVVRAGVKRGHQWTVKKTKDAEGVDAYIGEYTNREGVLMSVMSWHEGGAYWDVMYAIDAMYE